MQKNLKKKKEKNLREYLKSEFIRINPDKENFYVNA